MARKRTKGINIVGWLTAVVAVTGLVAGLIDNANRSAQGLISFGLAFGRTPRVRVDYLRISRDGIAMLAEHDTCLTRELTRIKGGPLYVAMMQDIPAQPTLKHVSEIGSVVVLRIANVDTDPRMLVTAISADGAPEVQNGELRPGQSVGYITALEGLSGDTLESWVPRAPIVVHAGWREARVRVRLPSQNFAHPTDRCGEAVSLGYPK